MLLYQVPLLLCWVLNTLLKLVLVANTLQSAVCKHHADSRVRRLINHKCPVLDTMGKKNTKTHKKKVSLQRTTGG